MTVLPNGVNYDLSTYDGRQAARDANPSYVVDSGGYLLRGSGGTVSSDPSRGGGSGNPAIQGGAGTPYPNGAIPGQNIGIPAEIWNAVVTGIANNTIPGGPGGSYAFPIAALVSAGHSIESAIASVLGGATDASNNAGTDPSSAGLAAANAASKGVQGTNPQGLPLITPQNRKTFYMLGGGALVALLLLRRR
jgi:hypothetical protein